MSSVSGNPGQNPNPIPEDPNSRLDNVDNTDTSSQDQESASGVTDTGLSVDVLSAGEVANIDAPITDIQGVAGAVIAVGTPSSLSPSSPEVAGLAEEIVTDFYEEGPSREDSQKLEESAADLFAGFDESKSLVDDLKKGIGNFQKSKLDSMKQTSQKAKLREGASGIEEQFLDLRRGLAELNGCVNQLESKASIFMDALSDTHYKLVGVSMSEFRDIFGSEFDRIFSDLHNMGIVFENGSWNINPECFVLRLALGAQNLRVNLENLVIPTEEGVIKTATEEDISCCRALINKLKTLWNTLVQMFHTLYDKMLFFLFWIAKKIRSKLPFPSADRNEKNPKFENPFASTSGTTSERQNTASVRASVSGRGDLSDEEMIRRPEDNTIETQDVDNQEEDKKDAQDDS